MSAIGSNARIQSTSSSESLGIIKNFINVRHTGALATADSAANPHAAVIYFTFNEDYTFSFVTKTETQKYKNIEENNNVALVIYDEANQDSVQVTGRVEVIEDRDEVTGLVNRPFKYSAEISRREIPPLEKLFAGEYVALKLIPKVIKMAVFARPDSGEDELYEIVLFD